MEAWKWHRVSRSAHTCVGVKRRECQRVEEETEWKRPNKPIWELPVQRQPTSTTARLWISQFNKTRNAREENFVSTFFHHPLNFGCATAAGSGGQWLCAAIIDTAPVTRGHCYPISRFSAPPSQTCRLIPEIFLRRPTLLELLRLGLLWHYFRVFIHVTLRSYEIPPLFNPACVLPFEDIFTVGAAWPQRHVQTAMVKLIYLWFCGLASLSVGGKLCVASPVKGAIFRQYHGGSSVLIRRKKEDIKEKMGPQGTNCYNPRNGQTSFIITTASAVTTAPLGQSVRPVDRQPLFIRLDVWNQIHCMIGSPTTYDADTQLVHTSTPSPPLLSTRGEFDGGLLDTTQI